MFITSHEYRAALHILSRKAVDLTPADRDRLLDIVDAFDQSTPADPSSYYHCDTLARRLLGFGIGV